MLSAARRGDTGGWPWGRGSSTWGGGRISVDNVYDLLEYGRGQRQQQMVDTLDLIVLVMVARAEGCIPGQSCQVVDVFLVPVAVKVDVAVCNRRGANREIAEDGSDLSRQPCTSTNPSSPRPAALT